MSGFPCRFRLSQNLSIDDHDGICPNHPSIGETARHILCLFPCHSQNMLFRIFAPPNRFFDLAGDHVDLDSNLLQKRLSPGRSRCENEFPFHGLKPSSKLEKDRSLPPSSQPEAIPDPWVAPSPINPMKSKNIAVLWSLRI